MQIKNQKEKLVLRFYTIENIKGCGEKKLLVRDRAIFTCVACKDEKSKDHKYRKCLPSRATMSTLVLSALSLTPPQRSEMDKQSSRLWYFLLEIDHHSSRSGEMTSISVLLRTLGTITFETPSRGYSNAT